MPLSNSRSQLTWMQLKSVETLFADDLRRVTANIHALKPQPAPTSLAALTVAVYDMQSELSRRAWVERLRSLSKFLLPVMAWIFIIAIFLLCFWIRPLVLLHLDRVASVSDFTLPAWLGGVKIRLRTLLLLSVFANSDRTLDAWISSIIGAARSRFEATDIALAHPFFCPTSVHTQCEPRFRGNGLDDLLQFGRVSVLLIMGEGGLGKTTLACQIARWGMSGAIGNTIALPAVIDFDLPQGQHFSRRFAVRRGLCLSVATTSTKNSFLCYYAGAALSPLWMDYPRCRKRRVAP